MAAGRPDGPARRVPELCEEWRLVPGRTRSDGDRGGTVVLPVTTDDGGAAVLKVVARPRAAEREALALQTWHGRGAVRLLRADPGRGALLLERAGAGLRELGERGDLTDVEACEAVGSLFARLHVPAPPRVPSLVGRVRERSEQLGALPRGAPLPRRLVEQALSLGRRLAAPPDDGPAGRRLLHGDLHVGHVLASDREPWVAISPDPVSGDPHAEVAPVLWHGRPELVGDVRTGLRRRFHAVVDAAGLDEDLARDWVVLMTVHRALALLEGVPASTLQADLTACVAVAKAVQE